MRTRRVWRGLALAVILGACATGPKDPVAVDPGHYTVLIDNAAVRVLKISYAPGDRSTMHHHPDSIVVALASSKTRFTLPDGSRQDADLVADQAMYMPSGDHNPENAGSTQTSAILVEFKGGAPGTATLPAVREGMEMTVLAEGARGTAFRSTAAPTFMEPEGTTHEYDQVVIALGPAEVSLTIDGKLVKSTWARGDVQFIGRGVPHSSKNTGGTAADYVLVAIR